MYSLESSEPRRLHITPYRTCVRFRKSEPLKRNQQKRALACTYLCKASNFIYKRSFLLFAIALQTMKLYYCLMSQAFNPKHCDEQVTEHSCLSWKLSDCRRTGRCYEWREKPDNHVKFSQRELYKICEEFKWEFRCWYWAGTWNIYRLLCLHIIPHARNDRGWKAYLNMSVKAIDKWQRANYHRQITCARWLSEKVIFRLQPQTR